MEHFDSISETQLTNNQEPLVNTKTSKTKYAIQREKALTKLQNRFQQNRPLFLYVRDTMKNLLNDPTRVKLLFFTNLIANKIGKRVDRQAKRGFDPNICWICENWMHMQPFILECAAETNRQPFEDMRQKKQKKEASKEAHQLSNLLTPIGFSLSISAFTFLPTTQIRSYGLLHI